LEYTFSSQKYDDMIFQSASNPWEENQSLAKMYLEVTDTFDKTSSWRLDLPTRNEIVSINYLKISFNINFE
jgi:hypothetical protein